MDRDEAVDRVRDRAEMGRPAWLAGATKEVEIARWLGTVRVDDPTRVATKFRAATATEFCIDYRAEGELADIIGMHETVGWKYRTSRSRDHVAEVDGHGAPTVRYYPLEDGSVLCTTERFESPDLRAHIAAALISGVDVPECWMWAGFDWRTQAAMEAIGDTHRRR